MTSIIVPLLEWIHDRLTGRAPIGRCRYCGRRIYVPFGLHFDHCPGFRDHIDRMWKECFQREREKG